MKKFVYSAVLGLKFRAMITHASKHPITELSLQPLFFFFLMGPYSYCVKYSQPWNFPLKGSPLVLEWSDIIVNFGYSRN